jgi:class 3 adenylate cyclase
VSDERILVVDDHPPNIKLLGAILEPRGYTVLPAASGADALALVADERPDLVLLDIVMPELDGYETCRLLRELPGSAVLPVIMVTASGDEQKHRALEAGADDFIQKPLNETELLARVRSLLRIKRYQDDLAELNHTLEERVREQVEELERIARLKRFLAPQVVDLVVSAGDSSFLETHRREITALFCDLRGFTAFSETVEPEEVVAVLREYHDALASLIARFGATLDHMAGDGVLVYFNDPLPCPDPPGRATRMALTIREEIGALVRSWRSRGHNLDFGVGIALGHATLGTIGADGLFHYASIGTVTNLAARLSDAALGHQILISARLHAVLEDRVRCEPVGPLALKGFARPVPAFNVLSLDE